MSDIIRKIQWFKKTGEDEFLVDDEEISHLSPIFLINTLNLDIGDDPEMIMGDYIISDKEAPKLQPYIKHKIDTRKYDYFIATYTKDINTFLKQFNENQAK